MNADVIVVGAGPAGSATATFLARAGVSVLLLEKAASFPRDKTCGDGITPRAVHMLHKLGVSTDGWHETKGLRIKSVDAVGDVDPATSRRMTGSSSRRMTGMGADCEFPWPLTWETPETGYCVRREVFDERLARHAQASGAELVTNAAVTEPIINERGRITGVRTSDGREFRAPIVVSAEGVSSKLAPAMGLDRKPNAISGVAMRAYYTSPKTSDDHIELHLGFSGSTPGYGWVFPLGDGTVNVGAGLLSTARHHKPSTRVAATAATAATATTHPTAAPAQASETGTSTTNYRQLFDEFVASLPAEYGINESTRTSDIKGAMLPMALDRTSVYRNGLLLVGDAAGCVNPFNGEGIDYALESAELAANAIIEAKSRSLGTISAERALFGYRYALNESLRGYYRLGIIFAYLVGNPHVMRLCMKYGLPRPRLMRLVNKLLGNLGERGGADADGRLIAAMSKLVGQL
jgi:geranylgeranyl reductase family protein